jgi:hypothetical protein
MSTERVRFKDVVSSGLSAVATSAIAVETLAKAANEGAEWLHTHAKGASALARVEVTADLMAQAKALGLSDAEVAALI